MAQDIISDALNQIMNANKADKKQVSISRHSNLLLKVLKKMEELGHIKINLNENNLIIDIIKINECRTIKPRFYVQVPEIEKYSRRFLPSRNLGIMLISTSQGLIDHQTAQEKGIGGSLVAYFY